MLEAAGALEINPELIEQRFLLCGGSARECFRDDDVETLKSRMRGAAKACDAKSLLDLVDAREVYLSAYGRVGTNVALLVHILVNGTDTSYCFASSYAAELVTQKLITALQRETRTLIAQLVENKIEGTFAGVAMEYLLHHDLVKGCTVDVIDLCSQEQMVVKFPVSSLEYSQAVEDIAIDATKVTYWIPQSSREPAIDAVLPPQVCLQMTIARRHSLDQAAMETVIRHLLKVRTGVRSGWCPMNASH